MKSERTISVLSTLEYGPVEVKVKRSDPFSHRLYQACLGLFINGGVKKANEAEIHASIQDDLKAFKVAAEEGVKNLRTGK